MSRLTASNTLYVVRFKKQLSPDWKAAWALSLVTSTARESAHGLARRYADGLVKFEPGDISRIVLPRPLRPKGARGCYAKVVKKLLDGNVKAARSLADSWMNPVP